MKTYSTILVKKGRADDSTINNSIYLVASNLNKYRIQVNYPNSISHVPTILNINKGRASEDASLCSYERPINR